MSDHASSIRRIVTGHDADGKSTVIDDRPVAEGGAGNFDVWMSDPQSKEEDVAAALAAQPFYPRSTGSFFRIFRIPPSDPALATTEIEAFAETMFASFGISDCRIDTSRHPMMHRTPTIDYIVLLSGSISLLLDTGEPVCLKPFDVVVQRATNHAWINTGTVDALLMAVLNGKG